MNQFLSKPTIKLLASFLLITSILLAQVLKANRVENRVNANPKYLVAKYLVTAKDSQGNSQMQEFQLTRKDNQVMHSSNGVHYVWDKLVNGRMKLTKYVDKINKGIEYQPNDLKADVEDNPWQKKYQLLSDSQASDSVSAQIKVCEANRNCEKEQHKNSRALLTSIWLDDIQLPKSIQQINGPIQFNWTLESIELNQATVNKNFKEIEQYQLIDFADIGDAEGEQGITELLDIDLEPLIRQAIWSLDNSVVKPDTHKHGSHAH